MQPFRQAKQSAHQFTRVLQTLGQISRVVPAAIDDDALVAVDRRPIAMANAMHAFNGHSASLGVKEV